MIFDNIKSLCEKKGLSIAQLEKEVGFTNGTIGKWRVHSPTVANLAKVAEHLGVSVDWLMKQREM